MSKEPVWRAEMASATPQTPIVPIYLREMGATALLSKEEEVALARRLEESRSALARCASGLPTTARRWVLDGGSVRLRPRSQWALEEIDEFCARLDRYAAAHTEVTIASAAREARRHRRRLEVARDALILANLRLVIHIAKRYANQGVPLMDLIQEGNIGLMKAVERFRYKRGFKFSTYAYWWIKQAIDRAIADKARLIRIPVHVKEKLAKISRVANELAEQLGRKAKAGEIAARVGMTMEKVEALLGVVQDPMAFEDFGTDDEGAGLLPVIADRNAVSPMGNAVERERRERVQEALGKLDARSAEVLRLRFGIGYSSPHSLEQIGRRLHLSRERIRQIQASALRRIQTDREAGMLREFLGQ